MSLRDLTLAWYWPWIRAVWRLRWLRLRAMAAIASRASGARVTIEVGPHVRLGRRARFDFIPGTQTAVRFGADTTIGDDFYVQCGGGEIAVGEGCEIRQGVLVHSSGRLHLGAGAILGDAVSLHCAEELVIGELAGIGNNATIADSTHLPSGSPDVHFIHAVKSAPIHIGRAVWVAPQTVVTSGVTIGDSAFVGANAVVTGDLPGGWLSAGNPARPIRELEVDTGAG